MSTPPPPQIGKLGVNENGFATFQSATNVAQGPELSQLRSGLTSFPALDMEPPDLSNVLPDSEQTPMDILRGGSRLRSDTPSRVGSPVLVFRDQVTDNFRSQFHAGAGPALVAGAPPSTVVTHVPRFNHAPPPCRYAAAAQPLNQSSEPQRLTVQKQLPGAPVVAWPVSNTAAIPATSVLLIPEARCGQDLRSQSVPISRPTAAQPPTPRRYACGGVPQEPDLSAKILTPRRYSNSSTFPGTKHAGANVQQFTPREFWADSVPLGADVTATVVQRLTPQGQNHAAAVVHSFTPRSHVETRPLEQSRIRNTSFLGTTTDNSALYSGILGCRPGSSGAVRNLIGSDSSTLSAGGTPETQLLASPSSRTDESLSKIDLVQKRENSATRTYFLEPDAEPLCGQGFRSQVRVYAARAPHQFRVVRGNSNSSNLDVMPSAGLQPRIVKSPSQPTITSRRVSKARSSQPVASPRR